MNKIKSIIKENIFFFLSVFIFLIFHYLLFFKDGKILLGGEGNYWLNFSVYLRNFGNTWLNSATGLTATSLNSMFIYPVVMSFINNIPIKSFLITSSIYLFPYISMYLLLLTIYKTYRPIIINSTLIFFLSLFFIVNPFSSNYLAVINPWNTHILFIYPLSLLVFLITYNKKIQLFILYGIISLIFSYTLVNPPQMILYFISLPLIILIAQLVRTRKIKWLEILKRVITVLLSLALFHSWWIVHWFIVNIDVKSMYPLDIARTSILQTRDAFPQMFNDIFSFLWLTPRDRNYNFLSNFYRYPIINILLFIPFIIVISRIIFAKKDLRDKKIIFSLLIALFSIIMMLKGVHPPFENFIVFCFNHIPFCSVFKTAPEKFGVPFVFLFTLLLFFILKETKNKWITRLLYFCILILLIPFIYGKYIPEYRIDGSIYGTRKYFNLPEYNDFYMDMLNKKLNFRILSLPSGGNYQIMMYVDENKYYTGLDPFLYNIPQSFIADYSGLKFRNLFTLIDDEYYEKLLALYSIKYIHLNKGIFPWFGNITEKSIFQLDKILTNKYQLINTFGKMKLFNNNYFLPHFYTPNSIISTNQKAENLPKILSQKDYSIRSAIFFEGQNDKKKLENLQLKELKILDKNNPILEFKQINVTKYKIRVHNAKETFPLVFSESYHDRWQVYLVKSLKLNVQKSKINEYKILVGNEDDQATKVELQEYLSKGWVTELGDGKGKKIEYKKYDKDNKELYYKEKYTIDFISRNFQGTIQNNNLPSGSIWETWLPKKMTDNNRNTTGILQLNTNTLQIPNDNHLMVNGYANSWIIDPKKLCEGSNDSNKKGLCTKNEDGSYDLELAVEYWPQRFFYFDIGILVITLIGCFFYIGYSSYTRIQRKREYYKDCYSKRLV